MRPTVDFRSELDGVSTFITETLDHIIASVKGSWSIEHKDDDTHGNIHADSVTAIQDSTTGATGTIKSIGGTVGGTGTGNHVFGGDVYANADAVGSAAYESSLRGAIGNASVNGPGLGLGTTGSTYAWQIIANTLRGAPAGSVAALEFVAKKDSTAFRRAMQLTQADTPVSGEYYILPSVTGKLYLGAASGVFGAFSGMAAIEAVYSKLGIFERSRTVAMGEWNAVAFAAGNFTSVGGGTAWTVIAANQVNYAYTLIGKTMILAFSITGSNVTGAPTELGIAIPGGFSANKTVLVPIRVLDAGVGKFGIAQADAAGTKVRLFTSVGGGGWTATAGSDTYVQGTIFIELP